MLKLYKHKENKSIILSDDHIAFRKKIEREKYMEMKMTRERGHDGFYRGGYDALHRGMQINTSEHHIESLMLVNPFGEKSDFNFFDLAWKNFNEWEECEDKIFLITTSPATIDKYDVDYQIPFVVSTRGHIFFNSIETEQVIYISKKDPKEIRNLCQLSYYGFSDHITSQAIIRDNLEFKNFNYKRHREEMKNDRIQSKMMRQSDMYQQVFQQRVENREYGREIERNYYDQLRRNF